MNLFSLAIFACVFLLFSIAGFIWRIDKVWYNSLKKPFLTPKPIFFAVIWPILFVLISVATALMYNQFEIRQAKLFYIVLFLNYIFNQAYSYIQFKKKDLFLSSIDAALVAISSLALVLITFPLESIASILLFPYFLWTSFATYLAIDLYSLNKNPVKMR